jgi:hypothetical protein
MKLDDDQLAKERLLKCPDLGVEQILKLRSLQSLK